jgi:hypothetical protein
MTSVETQETSDYWGIWSQRDALRCGMLFAVAVVLLIMSWYLSSEDATLRQEIGPANLSVVALIVAGGGLASWFLVGRRKIRQYRQSLFSEVGAKKATSVTLQVLPALASSDQLVAGDGLSHFHRSDCLMAANRDWASGSRSEHERAQRTPCGVCRP